MRQRSRNSSDCACSVPLRRLLGVDRADLCITCPRGNALDMSTHEGATTPKHAALRSPVQASRCDRVEVEPLSTRITTNPVASVFACFSAPTQSCMLVVRPRGVHDGDNVMQRAISGIATILRNPIHEGSPWWHKFFPTCLRDQNRRTRRDGGGINPSATYPSTGYDET